MPLSEHPWPLLVKAGDRGLGVTLTAEQVRELLADYNALVEKANEVVRAEWAPTPEPTRAT